MAVISTTDYLDIVNDYADAQNQLAGISSKYFDAAYEIVLLQVLIQKLIC